MKVMIITPENAKEMLKKNRNRTVRKFKLEAFKADMINGRWRFNGDPIRFYADGSLADGQHRLLACVETGVPFRSVVIEGLSEEDAMTIDTGSARSNADVLVLQGGLEKEAGRDAAGACRMLIPHDLGYMDWINPGGNATKWLTSQAVFDYFVENMDEITTAMSWTKEHVPSRNRVISSAMATALRVLTARVDEGVSHEYLKRILSGFNVEERSTESHVRNALVSAMMGTRKMNPRLRLLTACKGFRSVSSGRTIKHANNVVFRDGYDSFPKFPGYGKNNPKVAE